MNPQTNTPGNLSPDNAAIQPVQQPPSVPSAPLQAAAPAVPLPQKIIHKFVRPEFIDYLSDWLFRIGFASIFLVNALYAALDPASFVDLLSTNMVGRLIGHADLLVKFVIINDLAIGIFILINKYKKAVYIWAGAWLLIVAGIKLMNLL